MVSGAVAGLVLAAGASSRLGRPKQNLIVDGQTLLGRTVDALDGAGCGPIFVVTGAGAASLERDWNASDVRLVHNRAWSEGMGGSIACGVRAVREVEHGVAALIVTVCDQPKLDASVLRRLVDRYSQEKVQAVACEYAGSRGVPALFDRRWFERLGELRGDEGARGLLRAPGRVATISWPDGAIDIDRSADLDRLG